MMGKCKIQISSGGRVQEPPVIEGITWETTRKGAPGKLVFTCVKTDGLSFSEGAEVRFIYEDTNVFHGFVFEKRRNKDQHIECTCYDQLRYLQNQTSYIWKGVRADQVVKRIADDFKLSVGDLPNTGVVIPKFDKDNMSLFDMILDAIDETCYASGNLYYIYDEFGKIVMKNIKDSTVNLVIKPDNAEDFDYTTSIDKETYNRVVIADSENKSSSNYIHLDDDTNQGKWGVLQKFITMKNGSNTQAVAEAIMKMYNKVSRSLTMKGCLGDIRVRAGCGIYLEMYLGDMNLKNQRMLVEKAVHTFDDGHHYMNLTLNGNEEFYD